MYATNRLGNAPNTEHGPVQGRFKNGSFGWIHCRSRTDPISTQACFESGLWSTSHRLNIDAGTSQDLGRPILARIDQVTTPDPSISGGPRLDPGAAQHQLETAPGASRS